MLILASSSVYREQILNKLSINFKVVHPNVDEKPKDNESPRDLVIRLAEEKASNVYRLCNKKDVVVAADQVVEFNNKILTKPHNFANAFQQLKAMSNNKVICYTSLCVMTDIVYTDIDVCCVHFRNLTDEQITKYLQKDKPFDCAGSFKAEGLGISLFTKIVGEDPNSLIGLPLIKLITILNKLGINVP